MLPRLWTLDPPLAIIHWSGIEQDTQSEPDIFRLAQGGVDGTVAVGVSELLEPGDPLSVLL